METEVKEAQKKKKVAVKMEDGVEDAEGKAEETETTQASKREAAEKIKYGFHCLLIILSRMIDGLQSFYTKLFIVDEAVDIDFHKEHGFNAFEKGHYEKAVDHFLEANKEKTGKDPEVLFYLGLSYANQEHYDKAILYLKKAETLKADDADIVSEIGNCLMKLERHDDAIGYLKQVIEMTPEVSANFYALGTACEKVGKLDEAIESYKHAIEIDPRDPIYYHALGFAYESQGKHADAIACFRKAMEFEKHHK